MNPFVIRWAKNSFGYWKHLTDIQYVPVATVAFGPDSNEMSALAGLLSKHDIEFTFEGSIFHVILVDSRKAELARQIMNLSELQFEAIDLERGSRKE
ncbi:MAG: hypothetical protein AB1705_17000 [Verrucomicrobiota bacterium]